MAGETEAVAGHGTEVDIDQAQSMWHSFVRLVKWGIGVCAAALVLLAIFLVWT